jgi:hypothetical protein
MMFSRLGFLAFIAAIAAYGQAASGNINKPPVLPPMTGSPVYSQDSNLRDFLTACETPISPGPAFATFVQAFAVNSINGNVTLPYTATVASLLAANSPRIVGQGVPSQANFSPIVVQFPAKVSQIVVFPSLDHTDSGNGSHAWDAYQYAIYGGNSVGNLVSFTLLFDPEAAAGTDNSTGTPPSYFTLTKWDGTGPTLVNNVLTPGQAFGGTIGYEAYFDFSAAGGPYQFYGFTASNLAYTAPNGEQEAEISAVGTGAPCGTGFLEVCKQSSVANPVTGDFFFQVTPSTNASPISLRVPVGSCSGPVQFPVGATAISEVSLPAGVSVNSITASGGAGFTNRLAATPAPNLSKGTATVMVVPGDPSDETVAVYTNQGQAPAGLLKICKVNGGGVYGNSYTFNVGAQGGSTASYSVTAGSSAQGGNCIEAATYPVGTAVTVTEPAPSGPLPTTVTAITVTPSTQGTSCTSNCPRAVTVTIGNGVTEVSFANKGFYVVTPDRWVPTVLGTLPAQQILSFSSSDSSAFTLALASTLPSWLTAVINGANVTLTANPSGLSPNIYEAAVTFNVTGTNSTTVTVPVQLAVVSSVPAVGGGTPPSGSGTSQNFTFTFSHPAGYQSLGVVNVLINSALDGRRACYLAYEVQNNRLDLVDDAGDAGGPYSSVVLGGAGTISNSQCAVTLSGAQGSGNNLTLNLGITFLPAFGGNKTVYVAARDQGAGNTNWQALGVWQVPFTPGTISVNGISPSRGAGSQMQFVLTVTDTKGAADLGVMNLLINGSIDGRQGCYFAYSPAAGTLYLVDDTGDAGGPFAGQMPLNGTNTSISNSRCSVSGAGSAVSNSGNITTLTLNIGFTQAFSGNQIVYAAARDRSDGNNTGWQAVGTWTVQ